jgi:hypothetical protein
MEQRKLDVGKWQAARPQWVYSPVLWFFYRMIEEAYIDACAGVPMVGPLHGGETRILLPTDEGLLARDWIARSTPVHNAGYYKYVSFSECCEMLSLNADRQRVELLNTIDAVVDMDNDEAWARLERLRARELPDDTEPLFDAPRVVPVRDQLALF